MQPRGTKAERTRRRILAAAERQFAAGGFHGARLQDIAEEVGIQRAALFYHFRDKQALHDAVLRATLEALLARLQEIMARDLPFAERAGQVAAAWVDQLAERPAAARLLLREIAAGATEWRRLVPIATPMLEWMRHELRASVGRGEINPVDEDPLALLGALVGSTALAPGPEATRRQAAIRRVRRLLGAP